MVVIEDKRIPIFDWLIWYLFALSKVEFEYGVKKYEFWNYWNPLHIVYIFFYVLLIEQT